MQHLMTGRRQITRYHRIKFHMYSFTVLHSLGPELRDNHHVINNRSSSADRALRWALIIQRQQVRGGRGLEMTIAPVDSRLGR